MKIKAQKAYDENQKNSVVLVRHFLHGSLMRLHNVKYVRSNRR